MTYCQWFALCTNEAVGCVTHSILGDVPICERCAEKVGLTADIVR